MVATVALAQVFGVASAARLLRSSRYFPALLSTLLMRIGTASGVDDGTSSKDAVAALQAFVRAVDDEKVALGGALEASGVWKQLASSPYEPGLAQFVRVFCAYPALATREHRAAVAHFLADFLSERAYFGQRNAATCVLAELVLHCGDESPLLVELVQMLLPRVVDGKERVRKQALVGLGNLEKVWNAHVAQEAPSVLSALTSASEDQAAGVAAQAVASLTCVVRVVNEATIGPMIINICYRMRPAFDRQDEDIRKAAYDLFAELCRVGGQSQNSAFIEQVHSLLVTLLLHTADDSEAVRAAAFVALQKASELLHKEVLQHLESAPDVAAFEDFSARISPVLVTLFPNRLGPYLDACVSYFKSSWSSVRANAAVFSAQLLASARPELRARVNVSSLCGALTKLLNEESAIVRAKAARGLSLLYDL
jgi:hypothetical protein